jgi:hypothetical protein
VHISRELYMKCPKCGYFGPDSLNTCKKCGKELFAEKAKLGLRRSFKPRTIQPKEPGPPSLISEIPISAYPLQEKTSPLFTNDPPELLIAPQFVKPEIKKQNFPTEPFEVMSEEQEKRFGGELKAAFPFETKHGDTLPLATQEDETQEIKMSPNDVEDFEFPEDLTKKPPPLSALSSNEELFLPDEQEQEKIDLSRDDASLSRKEGDTELLSSEERGKILRVKNPSQEQYPGESPPGRIQTEYIEDEEITQILQEINHGNSEPDITT